MNTKVNPSVIALDSYITALAADGRTTFRQADLVEVFGWSKAAASRIIQRFQATQASGNGHRLDNRLYRVEGTRTANTVWTYGDRSADIRHVGRQFTSDMRTRVEVLGEYFNSVGLSNPRARAAIGRMVAVMDASIQVLEEVR